MSPGHSRSFGHEASASVPILSLLASYEPAGSTASVRQRTSGSGRRHTAAGLGHRSSQAHGLTCQIFQPLPVEAHRLDGARHPDESGLDAPPAVANVESAFSRSSLLHWGHAGRDDPYTSVSNRCPQRRHSYSYKGISLPPRLPDPLDRQVASAVGRARSERQPGTRRHAVGTALVIGFKHLL